MSKLRERTTATLFILLTVAMFIPAVMAKGGFDEFGYNYQANIFNGWYGNYARPPNPIETGEIHLQMKWNDAWLDENKDRHVGYETYDGSGAWLTNHMWGRYEDGTKWTYFVKIITPSTDDGDYVDGPTWEDTGEQTWYNKDNIIIGKQIWGAFAIIQEFENNVGHDLIYKSPCPVGFGAYPPS